MNSIASGIFALVIGAAGWYYVFYSKAAQKLEGVEGERINQRRVRLRRLGGVCMILLAMSMYLGAAGIDPDDQKVAFVVVWVVVMALVCLITVLALIDLRLTKQLKDRRKREQS